MLEDACRQVHHKLNPQELSQMVSRRTQVVILRNQHWHYQQVLFTVSLILLHPFKKMGWFLTPVTHIVSEHGLMKSDSYLSFLAVAINFSSENSHCSNKRGYLQYGQCSPFGMYYRECEESPSLKEHLYYLWLKLRLFIPLSPLLFFPYLDLQ